MTHNLEKYEKLVSGIEKSIPTIEYIKDRTSIDVISIKKYFPQAYKAKRIIITGVYIIFTKSKERYINLSKDVLSQIDMCTYNPDIKDILVVYIFETNYADARHLKSWIMRELKLEQNKTMEDIIPRKIENIIPKDIKIEDIIPKNITVTGCVDDIPIGEIENIPHVPGVYILQFVDRECYVGSSVDLHNRLKRHRSRLSNFISNVSICEMQRIADAKILEDIFIKMLEPKYNCLLRSSNDKQSINTQRKNGRCINRSYRGTQTQLISISKDISELLNKKMLEFYDLGIFSWSIQTLAEISIKEGLNIVCDNISQVSEMKEIERYIDSQKHVHY